MRRLNVQLLIRTDQDSKDIVLGYCKKRDITLVNFLEEIVDKIKKGEL